ncbi:enoyl-CoA hydratase/isomerase family protein [Dactylosporangium sp. AC04546]|uniref:enoyl-CoA hydratase/isomerase family protein n=1 Tax=Dactylosporangium sp. AC04546 TaxID=2862460 RepID=UPI001EDDA4AF|nr:enoyl-CoA hydratase/isomerase family protein [Dactylosporangium sp. AC04546]WVK86583.1 enoyl-CoA hydratase/isomerase family protein [Dactylosporangium sp. AC04546]
MTNGLTNEGIEYDERDGIATIRLNRPDVGNALSRRMRPRLRELWAKVRDDPSVRVVIVTGTGDRHFCTGADVREVADTGTTTSGQGTVAEDIVWSPLQNQVWKPVICAVNGLVAGGGLHFVADADVVVAADHAQFMDTHVSVGQVGAVENIGLARRLPLGTVLRMTLTGKGFRLDAARAYQLGLVDELVPAAGLMDTAWELAVAIAANSPSAVSRSKQAIWGAAERPHQEALEYGWELARRQWTHPDFLEGARAFVQRRPPQWNVEVPA